MNGRQAIIAALEMTKGNLAWYVSDFTDADLLVRPVPQANHAAWQIGNVIGGDFFFLHAAGLDVSAIKLPDGFADKHGTKGAADDSGFHTKAEYLKLFDEVRGAAIAAVGKLNDADLDKPMTGEMAAWAPTLGHVLLMMSNHTLMHVGQFSVIRRKLGKPVLF